MGEQDGESKYQYPVEHSFHVRDKIAIYLTTSNEHFVHTQEKNSNQGYFEYPQYLDEPAITIGYLSDDNRITAALQVMPETGANLILGTTPRRGADLVEELNDLTENAYVKAQFKRDGIEIHAVPVAIVPDINWLDELKARYSIDDFDDLPLDKINLVMKDFIFDVSHLFVGSDEEIIAALRSFKNFVEEDINEKLKASALMKAMSMRDNDSQDIGQQLSAENEEEIAEIAEYERNAKQITLANGEMLKPFCDTFADRFVEKIQDSTMKKVMHEIVSYIMLKELLTPQVGEYYPLTKPLNLESANLENFIYAGISAIPDSLEKFKLFLSNQVLQNIERINLKVTYSGQITCLFDSPSAESGRYFLDKAIEGDFEAAEFNDIITSGDSSKYGYKVVKDDRECLLVCLKKTSVGYIQQWSASLPLSFPVNDTVEVLENYKNNPDLDRLFSLARSINPQMEFGMNLP